MASNESGGRMQGLVQANQGGNEEMRRGADYRFTAPKGGDFIPARLVMMAPASNASVSSSTRDPIRWYA